MHARHRRREHEDLPQRHRFGDSRDIGAAQLERDVLRLAPADIRVGAHGGIDQAKVAAQNPVVVEAGDVLEVGQHAFADRVDRVRVELAGGIEQRLEELHQLPGDMRVSHQTVVLVAARELGPQQLAILPVGTQDRDLAPREPPGDHQPVQPVRPGTAVPDRAERLADQLAQLRPGRAARRPGRAHRNRGGSASHRRHPGAESAPPRPPSGRAVRAAAADRSTAPCRPSCRASAASAARPCGARSEAPPRTGDRHPTARTG